MTTALLISNSSDVHTDLLVRAARERTLPFFRLNTDHFRRDGGIRLLFGRGDAAGTLRYRDKAVDLEAVTLIVYRRPQRAYENDSSAPIWTTWIVDQEWKRVEETLSVMATAAVVNRVGPSAVARNKLAQLVHAGRVGLDVPRSLVTTEQTEATSFAADYGRVVTKGISASYVLDGEIVRTGFTRLVEHADLDMHDPTGCPILLQEHVPPAAVWRIAAVGEATFGVRYTGAALKEVTDARLVHQDLHGEPCDVPQQVARGLRELCHSLGILFCSADFVETADGRLVFLDLNPDGQWAWLQLEFDLPIADQIIGLAFGDDRREGGNDLST